MMTSLDRSGTAEQALAEEGRLLDLYHAELLRKNPVVEYSRGQLGEDVKLVWSSHLVAAARRSRHC